MIEALDGFELGGIQSLIPFHRRLLETEQWRAAETCRDLLGDRAWLKETAADRARRTRLDQAGRADILCVESTQRCGVRAGRVGSVTSAVLVLRRS